MNKTPSLLLALLIAPCLGGCETFLPPETAPSCDESGAVTGTVQARLIEVPARSDVVIAGALSHQGGLAIREVLVAGIPATSVQGNFALFEVSLPIALLAQLADDETNTARVPVTATDSCGVRHDVDTVDIEVDENPDVDVQRLELNLALPAGRDFLPADETRSTQVTVVANPEAAGARVTLSVSGASFEGGLGAISGTLSGDRQGDATLTALLIPSAPGPVILTASARGVSAARTVTVAGAPALIPQSGTLAPGETVQLTVFGDGKTESCRASGGPGFTATSAGQDLLSGPGGGDVDGDGRFDVTVTATDALIPGAQLGLSCQDAYGQTGAASFDADLEPGDAIVVQSLTLEAIIPGEEAYLPTAVAVPAVIVVTGNKEAAGAAVALSATGGRFDDDAEATLTLSGDGSGPATATALFVATTPGPLVVTALAQGTLASDTLVAAGPPVLLPAGATLAPGDALTVSVQTGGRLTGCQASGAAGISVTSGGADLTAGGAISDTNGDGAFDFTLSIDAGLASTSATTVTCADAFGQQSGAIFEAIP